MDAEIKKGNEFNVLGCTVKFNPEAADIKVSADEIVSAVQKEAQILASKAPSLQPNQVAVLLALKFAGEKMDIQHEYEAEVNRLESAAKDALNFIEEATNQD